MSMWRQGKGFLITPAPTLKNYLLCRHKQQVHRMRTFPTRQSTQVLWANTNCSGLLSRSTTTSFLLLADLIQIFKGACHRFYTWKPVYLLQEPFLACVFCDPDKSLLKSDINPGGVIRVIISIDVIRVILTWPWRLQLCFNWKHEFEKCLHCQARKV